MRAIKQTNMNKVSVCIEKFSLAFAAGKPRFESVEVRHLHFILDCNNLYTCNCFKLSFFRSAHFNHLRP